MSGIEAAGLVLAVFPIVVSGLQHFTQGVATIKSWKRYQRELGKYSRTLETQRIVFLNTIERLFEGIVQSNDEFEALMKDPERYKPEYEEALRTRLGRSYDNFRSIMGDLLENLTLARGEMGISDDGKILWDDYSSLERQVKRLKLTLSKNIYTELLAQVKESNKELKEFAKDGHVLESGRSKRRSNRQNVDFKVIRRHAKSLYNAIVTRRAWKCRCCKHHLASLRLEPRPWQDENDKTVSLGAPKLKFRVLITKEQVDDAMGSSWRWQQMEVESIETSDTQTESSIRESQTLNFTTLSITDSSPSVPKKKAVSFVTPSASSLSGPSGSAIPPTSSSPDLSLITDICAAIEGIKGLNDRVGFLTDDSVGCHRHNIYLVDEQIRPAMNAQTLGYVLGLSQQRKPGFGLSRRDRLYIAVTLASSVLQLDGTSWLSKRWRSDDILFLPLEDRIQNTSRMDYSHPYVSWQAVANNAELGSTDDSDRSLTTRQIRNEFLFALGCTLIELSLKQRLHDRRIPEDIHPNNAMTDFNTAMRLVDEVYDESGSRYGDAVQRCLTCPFNLRDLRNFALDNEEFQEAVFDHIYNPLREDYEDFNGSQRIR